MAYRPIQQTLVCLVPCVFFACSTTATISRTDGFAYEANILGSDVNSLRVRDTYGREGLVAREEVADIDHPGNVNLTIGLILVALSAPLIIGDLYRWDSPQKSEWSGMGLVIGIPQAVTGLSLAIPGWLRYRRSKRAAAAFEDANPILPVPRPATLLPYPAPYPHPQPQPLQR